LEPWIFGLVFVLGGILACGGAILNLDVFMEHPKAKPFVKKFGRTGARVFYLVIGLLCLIVGAGLVAAGS